MGSKSRSKGDNKSMKKTDQTMSQLAKGKTSNSEMMDILSMLQNSQLGGMLPIMDVLMQAGSKAMTSNPMMPFFGGQQMPAPPSLMDAFQPQQPQPQPPQPQQPGGLTPEQQALMNFQMYAGNGRR